MKPDNVVSIYITSMLIGIWKNLQTPKYINWDDDTEYNMEKDIFIDLKRKTQSVIYLKSKFSRHLSFFIGQTGFNLRRMYAQLMHLNTRNEKDKKRKSPEAMIKNLTSCQRLAVNIQIATESLHDYDIFAAEEENRKLAAPKSTTDRDDGHGSQSEAEEQSDAELLRKTFQASREKRSYLNYLDSAHTTLRLRQLVKENEHRALAPSRKVLPKLTNVSGKPQKHITSL